MITRCALFLLCLGFASAETTVPLRDSMRTNGEDTLSALSWLDKATAQSLVQVLGPDGNLLLRGAVVSNDGYFITKASEAPQQITFQVVWPDGSKCEARTVRIDSSLDLLLAHTDKVSGIPVNWKASTSLAMGDWVAAATTPRAQDGCPLRLGVASAKRREIKSIGVGMGIILEELATADGVLIVEVAKTSPAEAAGLKQEDRVLSVDDSPVNQPRQVRNLISHLKPGGQVKLHVRRGDTEKDIQVRLASLSKIRSNWDGEDYANGGVSLRTDNFPEILQHEVPLQPNDMGGPVFDLEGNALGLNIARVDRVTTFVIPAEVLMTKIQEWMVEGRRKKPHSN